MLVRNLPTSNLYQEFGSGRNGLNLNCNPTLSRCITTCYAKKKKERKKKKKKKKKTMCMKMKIWSVLKIACFLQKKKKTTKRSDFESADIFSSFLVCSAQLKS